MSNHVEPLQHVSLVVNELDDVALAPTGRCVLGDLNGMIQRVIAGAPSESIGF